MKEYSESMLVFAARYAHSRNTGAAFMVVRQILDVWGELSEQTRDMILKERKEATCNFEDWAMLDCKET